MDRSDSDLFGTIKVIVISLAIVLPIRYFVVQPFIVRGASMEPSFENSEYLVVDELTYYFRSPERQEVIVFRFPREPRQFFIKRIIGLPGEKIEIKDGKIKIFDNEHPDGFILSEPYLEPANHPTYPNMSINLKSQEYFVLGDNRDFSSDSRLWGPLPRNLIVGRTMLRAWPIGRLGLVN